MQGPVLLAASIVVGLSAVYASCVRAQDSSEVGLVAALSYAGQNHPQVRAARSRLTVAELQLEAAQWQAFPSFALDASAATGGGGLTTLSLTQPVYTFGRIGSSISAAQSRSEAAIAAVNEAVLEVQLRVSQLYFEVLTTSDRLRVHDDNIGSHRRLVQMMTRRTEVGVGSSSDVQLVKTRLDQAVNDRVRAANQLQKSQQQLGMLLDRQVANVRPVRFLSNLFQSDAAASTQAIEFSPTQIRLSREAFALGQDASASRAAALPQAIVRAEKVHSSGGLTYSDNRLLAGFQFQPGAGLGALSHARAAVFKTQAAADEIEKNKRDVQERIRSVWLDIQSNRQQLQYLDGLKRSNVAIVSGFYKQYQAGKRSWLDLLNSQRETAAAELAYVDAVYAEQAAWGQLYLLTGRLTDAIDPSQTNQAMTAPLLLSNWQHMLDASPIADDTPALDPAARSRPATPINTSSTDSIRLRPAYRIESFTVKSQDHPAGAAR